MHKKISLLTNILSYSYEAHKLARSILTLIHEKDFDKLFDELENWSRLLELIETKVLNSQDYTQCPDYYADILDEIQKSFELLNNYSEEIGKSLTSLYESLRFELQNVSKIKKQLGAYSLGSVK